MRPVSRETQSLEHEQDKAKRYFTEQANRLLECRDPESGLTFVDMVVHGEPEVIYQRLSGLRVGDLLIAPGGQMALSSSDTYYPAIDMPKPSDPPQTVGLTVWGWGSWHDHARQVDIRLGYAHEGVIATEVISVNSAASDSGLPQASRHVMMDAYAEMGYEGHNYTDMYELTADDVDELLDLVTDMAGDEPLSTRELETKYYESYLQLVVLPESRAYIEEWVDNSWDGQVMAELDREELRIGGVALGIALMSPGLEDQAHQRLVAVVDTMRAEYNQRAAALPADDIRSEYIQPWRDGAHRSER